MSYGLQIFNGSSVSRLGPGDFIHNLVYTGVINLNVWQSSTFTWVPSSPVYLSGIAPTAEWFVIQPDGYEIATITIYNGYITASGIYQSLQKYAIYRR